VKIAFIYDAVYPWVKGGVERRIYELSKRLAKRHEEAAFEIAKKRGVRYIITDEIMGLKQNGGAISGKFPAIMSIAGYKINNIRMEDLFDVYNKSIYYRLHVENASNLTHFKLLKDFGSVKIFQVTN